MNNRSSSTVSIVRSVPSDLVVFAGERTQRIPSDKYKAMIIEIKKGKYKGKRDNFYFTFEIAEGPHKGVQIRGFVNAHYKVFSEYTKLIQWYERATGHPVEPGEEINLQNFQNRVLVVNVEDKTSKETKNAFSNVTDILSLVAEL